MHRITLIVSLAAVSACSDDSDRGTEARAQFRDTFETQRFQDLPAALAALDEAAQIDPDDPDTTLLQGLGNLWFVSELGRDASQASKVPAAVGAGLERFARAQTLRPDDFRVLGWYGGLEIGAGRFTNNAALVADGERMVADGVTKFPEFNLFVHALAYESYPANSPEFASVAAAFLRTDELCFGPIDPNDPDVTPYLHKETHTGPKRVCWNDDLAKHNFEGYFLAMGDVMVKIGNIGAARRSYQNAQLLPSYKTWPFRNVLVDRLATIEARAALYADSNPSNDPKLIGESESQCASCHAR